MNHTANRIGRLVWGAIGLVAFIGVCSGAYWHAITFCLCVLLVISHCCDDDENSNK